ncbi:NAD(P)H-dependent oxidoreductase [Lacisediminimonas sp.]|uniref:NAD(P)H-dependent oxidoreductase n=1 Tax=Lacisediminimonas sp. TaxID=3060582 RepID=UPI002722B568|nr:Gfo/Idh/MocA family oxidoreductase [Lacisediminimonas sp.]MDO8299943.1 Gfo/Idh/MocA family oxidoreductase [Lacisediminimonas sp.]
MNLYTKLQSRAKTATPIRVALIGAGKFGSMYLSQVPRTPGIHLVAIADLSPERARAALKTVHWPADRYAATSIEQAAKNGTTAILEDSMALIASPHIDIVIEATGNPAAGIAHVLACCEHKKHIVMVNVEADALAGPLLKRRADKAGIIYSLAYGDQPALICEMVDWARAAGFEIIAAGKGTKYLPTYHTSTPATVWDHYGLTAEQAQQGGMNPQMFNSFLDGTKSAIEMAAVANATGLTAPDGLTFPPVGVDELASVLCPREDGGILLHRGQVEVISSLERDAKPVFRDLRWGVYVTFAAGSPYVERCFQEYGLVTDPSGKYSSMYKPFHLIGLELGISVASIALRGEATGAPIGWAGDVVATAKRDLAIGETLDGEGGYTVYGKLMPAQQSMRLNGLPLGLAHGVKLTRAVRAGQALSWDDVAYNTDSLAVRVRREMETLFASEARTSA